MTKKIRIYLKNQKKHANGYYNRIFGMLINNPDISHPGKCYMELDLIALINDLPPFKNILKLLLKTKSVAGASIQTSRGELSDLEEKVYTDNLITVIDGECGSKTTWSSNLDALIKFYFNATNCKINPLPEKYSYYPNHTLHQEIHIGTVLINTWKALKRGISKINIWLKNQCKKIF